ncbi:putative Phosphatidylinositol transfer protein 1 [Blattamonas nauphoetae]|uniref:Phosphatidylinositol transfer protein 1 n=1 Tax=Blattamonas nauphoetae TaxID=2049346 RepID=A0ABQ9XAU3_9EUKA|nr:putative Phosphatidylinositol transfer protein 1 [Blattamonas nauphoetae]
MKIVEYRIFTPLSLDEFLRGESYMSGKAAAEVSGSGQGVETLLIEPWEYQGNPGFHSKKRMYIESRVPKFLRKLFPPEAWIIDEDSWWSGPYSKTEYYSPYMKGDLQYTCETIRMAGVSNHPNPVGLPAAELKKCKVDVIDIAQPPPKGKEYDVREDPTKWKSQKSGRGPLSNKGWYLAHQNTATPHTLKKKEVDAALVPTEEPFFFSLPAPPEGKEEEMKDRVFSTNPEQPFPYPVTTSHKVVHFHFKWFGLQSIVESYVTGLLGKVYGNTHKQTTCWLDEYYSMTSEEIMAFREQAAKKGNEGVKEEKKIVYLDDEEEEDGEAKPAPPVPPPSEGEEDAKEQTEEKEKQEDAKEQTEEKEKQEDEN